jgi:hypothetical protein
MARLKMKPNQLNFGSISEYSFADTPSYTPKGKSQPNIQLHDQPIMSDEQHEGIIASVVDNRIEFFYVQITGVGLHLPSPAFALV